MSAFGEISKAKSVLCLCPAHGFCTELELRHRPRMTQRLQRTTLIHMKCKFGTLRMQIVIVLYRNVLDHVHQNVSTLDALQDLALSPFTQITAYCSTLAWVPETSWRVWTCLFMSEHVWTHKDLENVGELLRNSVVETLLFLHLAEWHELLRCLLPFLRVNVSRFSRSETNICIQFKFNSAILLFKWITLLWPSCETKSSCRLKFSKIVEMLYEKRQRVRSCVASTF